MLGKSESLSSSETLPSSSDASASTEKKPFSLTSPSTWSTDSFSDMFKEETCEVKKDKTINTANKMIEKANADYNGCVSKRSGPKPASSGSFLSFLGLGEKTETTPAKMGGRKKTKKIHKKQKKQKKGNTNKRRTVG